MTARVHDSSKGLWSLVLAAGGSRRLGYPKQLVRDPVRPIMLGAVDAARSVTPGRVLIVLGAHALRLRALLARNYHDLSIIQNTNWENGISTSLLTGVVALPARARGVLVVLTDQPYVSAGSLQRLADAWRRQPGRAVAAGYAGDIGVPAILPRRLWHEIESLEEDVGARALLRSPRSNTRVVDLPEAAYDVDTAADRRRLEHGLNQAGSVRTAS